MDYSVSKNGDNTEVRISGRLTFAEHTQCRSIASELKDSESKKQVVDLKDVEFIDSAGLGLLLLLRDNAEKKGVQMSLRIPGEGQVKRMLEIARFQELIPIEDSPS